MEAIWLSLQQDKSDDYLICSGESLYLRDIISHVFNQLSLPKSKLVEDPNLFRPTDIIDIYGDNTKAKQKLGWNYNKSFYDVLDLLIEEEHLNF